MAYITLADLTERYGDEIAQWADRDNDGQPDPDFIAAVLADVDAEIDAHLAGRYKLPLTDVPRILVRLATALTRERLATANGARLDEVDPVRREAEGARQTLREIAAGRAHIGTPMPDSTVGRVQMESGGRHWDRTKSTGYL